MPWLHDTINWSLLRLYMASENCFMMAKCCFFSITNLARVFRFLMPIQLMRFNVTVIGFTNNRIITCPPAKFDTFCEN